MTTLISTTDYQDFTGVAFVGDGAAFTKAHDRVVARLERVLSRYLASTLRSERFTPNKDGMVYPKATPVTSVVDESGNLSYRFDETCIYMAEIPHGGNIMPSDPGNWTADGPGARSMPSAGTVSSVGTVTASVGAEEAGELIPYTGGYAPYGSNSTFTPWNGAVDHSDDQNYDLPEDLAEAIAWGMWCKTVAMAGTPLPQGIASMGVAGEFTITRVTGQILGPDGWVVPSHLIAAQDLGGHCLTLALGYVRYV